MPPELVAFPRDPDEVVAVVATCLELDADAPTATVEPGLVLPDQSLCCGLTWISTGQLDIAKRVLRRTVDRLAPLVREAGDEPGTGGGGGSLGVGGATALVGLEPSCLAVLRHDALAQLGADDAAAAAVARAARTLAEVLAVTRGWAPPDLSGGAVVLADGFSCRTQLDHLAGRRALHLAELLDPARP